MRAALGKFEVALGATQDAIAWTDALGRIEWCNAPFDRLVGLKHMAVVGEEITKVLPLDRWAAPPRAHPAEAVLASRSFATETIEVLRAGQRLSLEFFGSWVQGGCIDPIAVFVVRDVTARKDAEKALQQKAQELARSNAELQQFASAASHDLLEPLRKVAAFGDLLRKRAHANLDEQSREFLDRMQSAAARMAKLIDDLLQFSRIFGDTRPFQSVDLGQVAKEVVSDLERRIETSQAVIEVGELPSVNAHPFQMRQLFQNLIANALKFRSPEQAPRLLISARPGPEGFVELVFKDNGIGFEEQYAERIFQPFLRLHTRVEYEGTGLGLAICRRILLRHGGWIAARGDPGQGAVFIVTLPSGRRT